MSYYIQIYREPSTTPVEIAVPSVVDGMTIMNDPRKHLKIPLKPHDIITLGVGGVPISFDYVNDKKRILKSTKYLSRIIDVASKDAGLAGATKYEIDETEYCDVAWNTFWYHRDLPYAMMTCAYNAAIDKSTIAKTLIKIMNNVTENGEEEESYGSSKMKEIAMNLIARNSKKNSSTQRTAQDSFDEMRGIMKDAEEFYGRSLDHLFYSYSTIPNLWIHENSPSVLGDFFKNATFTKYYYSGKLMDECRVIFSEIIRSNINLESILMNIDGIVWP